MAESGLEENKDLIQIINTKKVITIKDAFEEIKSYYNNVGTSVSYNLNLEKMYPLNTVGSITITSSKLNIKECRYLVRLLKFADNISITPLLNGKFEYTLTFYDTMITIDEEGVVHE